MDCSIAELLVKSIWFAGPQYEDAIAKSEERIAGAHTGLKVEGKGIASSGAPSGIESIIGQAKSMIEESLRSTAKPAGDSSAVVSQLEKENATLKKRVSELESFIKSKGLSLPETTPTNQKSEPAAEDDDDDDFDPFASEDEEEKAEAQRLKEERLAAMEEKKKTKKPAPIAKSSIILEVKPWDDETDMKELERQVRNISMDGLQWKGSELKEIAYGIKKLQIICVVEDDKVGTDDLEEQICGLEDLVQSMDIMAFNKL